jgi:hypothetical protein
MPLQGHLHGAAFDLAAVKSITTAFDAAIEEFDLDRADPVAEIIARKIIECASLGERNPARLRDLATQFLRE